MLIVVLSASFGLFVDPQLKATSFIHLFRFRFEQLLSITLYHILRYCISSLVCSTASRLQ